MHNKALRRALTLSVVPRWSIVNTIKPQSVAEHTFNVVSIVRWLLTHYPSPGVELAELLVYALDHDALESVTGDVPATAKRAGYVTENVQKRDTETPDRVKELVKLADILEAKWFIRREMALGNTTLDALEHDIDQGILNAFTDFPWLAVAFSGKGMPPVTALYSEFFRTVNFQIHPGLEAMHAL